MIETDILIIGSGGSGCAAALEATKFDLKVHLITKGTFLQSKTNNAQGGIQAAIGENDSPELHYQDTLKAGEYQNKAQLAKILAYSAPNTIEWLESVGVEFDRENNQYLLQTAAGLTNPRILSCGDKSGNRLMGPLEQNVLKTRTQISEYTFPTSFHASGDGFIVSTDSRYEGRKTYNCKSIILACGGYVAPEKREGMQEKAGPDIPDIFELLEAIDLKIVFPDLVQYHPTGIILPKEFRRERVPETVRSAGATLLNKNLEEFCDSLETRNKLTKKIAEECKKGNGILTDDGRIGVWLNTPEVSKIQGPGFLENKFPSLYNKFKSKGIDIEKEMILVYPILHYSLGGIEIDDTTSTNIKGIFAAGEATYGVHGKDRLMGNSLLEIFVFGRLAGQNAAKYCLEN